MILGAVWKLKQSEKSYDSLTSGDQSHELSAVDESLKILDFCGHRNAFARKYANLLKDLRQKFSISQPNSIADNVSPRSSATSVSSPNLARYNTFIESPQSSLDFRAQSQEVFQNIDENMDQDAISPLSFHNDGMRLGHHPSISSDTSVEHWSEEFGIFYPGNESFNDLTSLLQGSDIRRL